MSQQEDSEFYERTSGHIAVSNEPDDSDFEIKELVSMPPSEGNANQANTLVDDEREGKMNPQKRPSGHIRVSNDPPDDDFLIESLTSTPPSGGEGVGSEQLQDDGREAVGGVRKSSSRNAERFSAPMSEALRDIGEASFGPPPSHHN